MDRLNVTRSKPSVLRAGQPGRDWRTVRLLDVTRPNGPITDRPLARLTSRLRRGDVLVLNDAATLPASVHGRSEEGPVELRLLGPVGEDDFGARWRAVVMGAGDWRTPTELRPAPVLSAGARLQLGFGLHADVRSRDGRLALLDFDRDGDALARALYAVGRPVQYSHLHHPLRLQDVQTPYASRPWASEMPSTGHPLRWPLLRALQERGVQLAWLTHAAGLSATGDPELDRSLPLPERYEIPEETARLVADAERVIAAGTTVVRALESAAIAPRTLQAGRGVATLRLDTDFALAVTDGILTGVHSPGESHWDLLQAFAPASLLNRAHQVAVERRYRAHEFGDLMLLL